MKGKIKYERHGLRYTSEYVAWANIVARCCNPNKPDYKNYGGRGVKICQGWRKSFTAFYRDMGKKEDSSHSIDRVENDKHYSCGYCPQCKKNKWKKNCKWADRTTQNNNSRRNNYLEYQNEKHTLAQWARILNINSSTFRSRFHSGWTVEKMITTPVEGISETKENR